MSNLRFAVFFTFLISAVTLPELTAQSSRLPAKKPEKVSPLGFGVNLGNVRFGSNSFEFGLSPNAAYRFSESLAAGLMLKVQYVSYNYKSTGSPLHFNGVDFGPTLFARWKPLWNIENVTPFLKGLFVQGEYEHAFIAYESRDEFGNWNVEGNRIRVDYVGEDYLYIGLGASAGYPFGTFVSVHYNLLDGYNQSRQAFDYRIGFTWNY